MIRFKVVKADHHTDVHVEGTLVGDEAAALTKLATQLPADGVRFHLGKLGKMNTRGIAVWSAFVQSLPGPYEFVDCPTSFIDGVNLFGEVMGAGRVATFFAPMVCPNCRTSADVRCRVEDVSTEHGFGAHGCPTCGHAPLEPDVAPEDYLTFLLRQDDPAGN